MKAIFPVLLILLLISLSACYSIFDLLPVADAGPAQVADVGDTVQLDGSGSISIFSSPLTYSWSFVYKPEGSTAQLSNPTAVTPYFILDLPGEYCVQLIVSDEMFTGFPDTVIISTFNACPIASAGLDLTAYVGETITLEGSGADEEGDPLTYQWLLIAKPEGSSAELSNPFEAWSTMTIDMPGIYVAELFVDDGTCLSKPDDVVIGTFNLPPMAEAGPNQERLIGSTVQLDGLGSSDPESNTMSFLWSILSKPSDSSALLSDPYAASPTFHADIEGDYVVQLIVNDGEFDSKPDTCMITVSIPLCPSGKGYWKNHPDVWPVDSLELGGEIYSKEELLDILCSPVRGDASLILAGHLIAAKLSIADGSDPIPIDEAIASADELLGGFSGKLPYKVKTSSEIGQEMVESADVLDSYGSGQLTPVCI